MNKTAFSFGTKYDNLLQLRGNLDKAIVPDLIKFTIAQWENSPAECLEVIANRFKTGSIIIRSSAPNEDSSMFSMAGFFVSVGSIAVNDTEAVVQAIRMVTASYHRVADHDLKQFPFIVQQMVQDVAISGVMFTRDLEKFGPYYVCNYDESGSTDAVTSGSSQSHRTVRIFRYASNSIIDARLLPLLEAVKEIELLTQHEGLDIEFAVDRSGVVYILQVRPIVLKKIWFSQAVDKAISKELNFIEKYLEQVFKPDFGSYGRSTILGQMPDWNPAEIIGAHPKPLSFSLYRYLLLKGAWREGRSLLGYKHPYPKQLMMNIGGRPYIDVRQSFHSLLPGDLPDALSEKLLDHYLGMLKANPVYHDKVEFEIVISSLDFDFEHKQQRLLLNGFSTEEVQEFRNHLLGLTNRIVMDDSGTLEKLGQRVGQLRNYREHIQQSDIHVGQIPRIVEHLLEECMYYGTIPFSAFARCAFIGSSFLKSMRSRGFLSGEQYDRFLRTIETVTSHLMDSFDGFLAGQLTLKDFLRKYGHLRPGTYDVQSYSYEENPELYLSLNDKKLIRKEIPEEPEFELSLREQAVLNQGLKELGFEFSAGHLFTFIKESLRKREAIKFEFTKNLSLALKLLCVYAEYHGISRDDLAFVEIEDILKYAYSTQDAHSIDFLKEVIQFNKKKYDTQTLMYFPDLITSIHDIKYIAASERSPNFITQKSIVAPLVDLNKWGGSFDSQDFIGKLILIENADPGFDWLFTKGIAGIVTKYGGVASHMAIRCAELGLPAAIGCGEELYAQLQKLLQSSSIVWKIKLSRSGFIMKAVLSQRIVQAPNYHEIRDALSQEWTVYMGRFGILPIPIPNVLPRVDAFLDAVRPDLIILTGGNTVAIDETDRREDVFVCRDYTERGLIAYAVHHGIPLLGVCRGMQMLHVYFGGKLGESTDGHVNCRHAAEFVTGTRPIWEPTTVQVNSYHNQSIRGGSLSFTLQPLAYSPSDQSVEAFLHHTLPIAGVMWHPERNQEPDSWDIQLMNYLLSQRK
ncbi:gamma-glutamyl-gamma-aminobutyrate hydrolase family protein [Paenibacillus hexagrammi]|uniref:Gamma-glutamyl-gamma-aminobutyrate hydrolase family protein n=1 Tax=Paenibacillus hexagrammi TaxID=2908839 RepID=A0ABY3SGU8_9BACL|nr:gamma-glutamyl-gamma-aminobutyrate hydrolase family protein [Paenibacillus sp. YPD9-1]UJF33209.1 gamma-glutamyl-gamma-aminobutyrate hydrolase family protein [Paenibacillus sp. YPD9-1]